MQRLKLILLYLFFAVIPLAHALIISPTHLEFNQSVQQTQIRSSHEVVLSSNCDWFTFENETLFLNITHSSVNQTICELIFSRTNAPESVSVRANVTVPDDVPRVKKTLLIPEIELLPPNISLQPAHLSEELHKTSFKFSPQNILLLAACILLTLSLLGKSK